MSVAQSIKTGGYIPAEKRVVTTGRFTKPGDARLIIIVHGRNGTSDQWFYNPNGFPVQAKGPPHLHALLDRSENPYILVAPDAGGLSTYGNQASIDALAALVAWARNPAGGNLTPSNRKVAIVAYSGGNAATLNYIRSHPGDVCGWVGEAPAADLDRIYASDPLFASEMNAAYSGSYLTHGTTHNPLSFADELTVPARMYHAINDTIINVAGVQEFYDNLASPDKAFQILPSGDHQDFWQYIDPKPLHAWIDELKWD